MEDTTNVEGLNNGLTLKQEIKNAFPELTDDDFGSHATDLYVQYTPEIMHWLQVYYAFPKNCNKFWSESGVRWMIEIPFAAIDGHYMMRPGKR